MVAHFGWNKNHPDMQLDVPGPSLGGGALIVVGLSCLLLDNHRNVAGDGDGDGDGGDGFEDFDIDTGDGGGLGGGGGAGAERESRESSRIRQKAGRKQNTGISTSIGISRRDAGELDPTVGENSPHIFEHTCPAGLWPRWPLCKCNIELPAGGSGSNTRI
jgi:hypothetical protein